MRKLSDAIKSGKRVEASPFKNLTTETAVWSLYTGNVNLFPLLSVLISQQLKFFLTLLDI